jgi:hypothetical protein
MKTAEDAEHTEAEKEKGKTSSEDAADNWRSNS